MSPDVINYEAKMRSKYAKRGTQGSTAYRAKRQRLNEPISLWEKTCLGSTAMMALCLCDDSYPDPIPVRDAWASARNIIGLPIPQRLDLHLTTTDVALTDNDISLYLQDCAALASKRLVRSK